MILSFFLFWKNSKFFQFVSKMSRGELIIEDNEVKQGSASQSSGWADEFQTQYNANANTWADQFVHEEVIPESWMHVNNCMAC
jgi:peroxin-5